MRSRTEQESGFAIPAAVLAMVLIGALITGTFFAASQETRAAGSARFASEAFYLAERGLEDMLGNVRMGELQTVALHETVTRDSAVVQGGTGQYVTHIRRMGDEIWFLRSRGTVLERGRYTGATREVGVMVRPLRLDIPNDGALQILGNLKLGGNAKVDGHDFYPWDEEYCPDDLQHKPGVIIPDDDYIDQAGINAEIFGEPEPVYQNPWMSADDLLDWDELDYDLLASMADKYYGPDEHNPTSPGPVAVDGKCDISEKKNWGSGDPDHPCFGYFPIIHMTADHVNMQSGYGQGILLVDGDLHLSGQIEFHGIMIVKGKLTTSGGGGGDPQLFGLVIVTSGEDAELESTNVGKSLIRYSSCSIRRAQQWSLRPVQVGPRSWVDLSASGLSG